MLLALGLFAIAAIGGVIMAIRVFGGAQPPWLLSALHAAFAAAALIVLFLAANAGAGSLAWTALAVLFVAALGGFFLGSFHLRGKPHPKPVVGLHAVLAVVGVGLLAAAIYM